MKRHRPEAPDHCKLTGHGFYPRLISRPALTAGMAGGTKLMKVLRWRGATLPILLVVGVLGGCSSGRSPDSEPVDAGRPQPPTSPASSEQSPQSSLASRNADPAINALGVSPTTVTVSQVNMETSDGYRASGELLIARPRNVGEESVPACLKDYLAKVEPTVEYAFQAMRYTGMIASVRTNGFDWPEERLPFRLYPTESRGRSQSPYIVYADASGKAICGPAGGSLALLPFTNDVAVGQPRTFALDLYKIAPKTPDAPTGSFAEDPWRRTSLFWVRCTPKAGPGRGDGRQITQTSYLLTTAQGNLSGCLIDTSLPAPG